jgi:REP element-mobilizing transposase RayT
MFSIINDTYFTTATILHWQPLLKKDEFKDIITGAFRYCVEKEKAYILAFVIMETHFHLVWQIRDPFELAKVRQPMLKFISQRIIHSLVADNNFEELENFHVRHVDRNFQIWKKNPLSIELTSPQILKQKINYVHSNMDKKGGSDVEYKYSSASYFATGIRNWDFLY